MHLPEQFSGVRVWEKVIGQSGHQKADFALREGTGKKQKSEECKAARL